MFDKNFTLYPPSERVLILRTIMTIKITAMMAPPMIPITRTVPGVAASVVMWKPPPEVVPPLPEVGGLGSGSLS